LVLVLPYALDFRQGHGVGIAFGQRAAIGFGRGHGLRFVGRLSRRSLLGRLFGFGLRGGLLLGGAVRRGFLGNRLGLFFFRLDVRGFCGLGLGRRELFRGGFFHRSLFDRSVGLGDFFPGLGDYFYVRLGLRLWGFGWRLSRWYFRTCGFFRGWSFRRDGHWLLAWGGGRDTWPAIRRE
jgi:hypothetical protein